MPNAYIVGIEEAANNDFQDLVYIIRNVAPYTLGRPGDFNSNGDVDAADYVVWRKNLGQPIALPNETATPGMVTQEDYITWRANFGASSPAAAAATLPMSLASSRPIDEHAVAAAVFASLGETPPAEDTFEEIWFAVPGISNQRARRVVYREVATSNLQTTTDDLLLNLDQYFALLQVRSQSRSDGIDSTTVGESSDADQAHDGATELGATGFASALAANNWRQH